MRTIDRIVVHCSDSPDTRYDIDVAEIRAWHTTPPPKGRGWQDVGYHYVIRRDGEIELGRLESVVGAHTEGYNGHSIGICWVGKNMIEPKQRISLVKLLRDLMERYKLGASSVFGHCELNTGKTCPNLDMAELRKELET